MEKQTARQSGCSCSTRRLWPCGAGEGEREALQSYTAFQLFMETLSSSKVFLACHKQSPKKHLIQTEKLHVITCYLTFMFPKSGIGRLFSYK